MPTHHLTALADRFCCSPSSFGLQNRGYGMNLLEEGIGRRQDILVLVLLAFLKCLHGDAHINYFLGKQRDHSSSCKRIVD